MADLHDQRDALPRDDRLRQEDIQFRGNRFELNLVLGISDECGEGYGRFKEDVAEAVVALLEPVRARYEALRADPAELERLVALGAGKARAAAEPTLSAMYERMGFDRP